MTKEKTFDKIDYLCMILAILTNIFGILIFIP